MSLNDSQASPGRRTHQPRVRAYGLGGAFALIGLCVLALVQSAPAVASYSRWETATLEAEPVLRSVSCTTTSGTCMAVGGEDIRNESQIAQGTEWWNWTSRSISPEPKGRPELYGVYCWTSEGCMAVGTYTVETKKGGQEPLAERWNGTAWTSEYPPTKPWGKLTSVSCTSASECNAVGTEEGSNENPDPEAFAAHWNGEKWTTKALPSLIKYLDLTETDEIRTESELNGIACSSTTACIAVGYYYYDDKTIHVEGQGALTESWNGTKWSVQSAQAGERALNAISCTSSTACTAVGTTFTYGDGRFAGEFTLAERWNGAAWTVESTPSPSSESDSLKSVSCTSSTECVAVGHENYPTGPAAPLVEIWNGVEWSLEEALPDLERGAVLDGVSCPSSTRCAAVGQYLDEHDKAERALVEIGDPLF